MAEEKPNKKIVLNKKIVQLITKNYSVVESDKIIPIIYNDAQHLFWHIEEDEIIIIKASSLVHSPFFDPNDYEMIKFKFNLDTNSYSNQEEIEKIVDQALKNDPRSFRYTYVKDKEFRIILK